MRKTGLLLPLLILLPAASGYVLGTFPQNLEKRTDSLETELEIGVFNAGNQEIVLEFSSPDSRLYNISLPERATLDPGKAVKNPEGENWHYIGNEKYVKVNEFSFEVKISEYRQDNSVNIPIELTARRKSEEGENPVIQTRSYNYTVLLDPSLRPLRRTGEQRRGSINYEDSADVPEEWRQEESKSSGQQNNPNRSKDYKASEEDKNTGESGANTVTLILVAGVIGSLIYILKVI